MTKAVELILNNAAENRLDRIREVHAQLFPGSKNPTDADLIHRAINTYWLVLESRLASKRVGK